MSNKSIFIEYDKALQDSKECLIRMYNISTKNISRTEKDFCELYTQDPEVYKTWVEYAYALLKKNCKRCKKETFVQWFHDNTLI